MALVPSPHSSELGEAPLDIATNADPRKMSFLDHLDELRKRLIITAVALLCGFLLCFALISPAFSDSSILSSDETIATTTNTN